MVMADEYYGKAARLLEADKALHDDVTTQVLAIYDVRNTILADDEFDRATVHKDLTAIASDILNALIKHSQASKERRR
ncbi:hypothetical protein [Macrococcus capreoli]|uniref:hypothetical protein n=1 Tax=Macrococcus capreoli TaxID=2982690 RepID=UPI0021D5D58D|nr:hypothetical protein [Macrococcus sp. TMW 2.2395]MCU7556602.1 hypothetical protein [Macrococcus sp. TMW 2.2395]